MAIYVYQGRDPTGKKTKGQVDAETKTSAVSMLKERGIIPIDIAEHRESVFTKDISISKGINPRELVMFLRQFSALLEAGISVVKSVHILHDQSQYKPLKSALSTIKDQVQEGESLSNAMNRHPNVFPQMVIHLTRVGEVSGNLDSAMIRLADYFEKRYEMRQKVISALTYPILLGVVSIAVLNVLLYMVVPRFTSMYANSEQELPMLTKWVLSISQFTLSYWWVFITLGFVVILAFYFFRKKEYGKYYIDYAILKVPILGTILQKTLIIEFSRTLSSLFTSSVPILQSMKITRNIVNNNVFKKIINESIQSVEEGNSMTVPMRGDWPFPPLVLHMILIGEQTGNLDAMLTKITQFYESEVDHITDRLQALLEPVLILFLSLVVGVIVLSVVLPMFGLYENINL
ncbi:type II secretion system F family protein [Pseudalkalibacillus berkeleyi]|uniref:Type II secretion system F family protein n=1 Tax=Pseudalkalibacillus berkeleyi TaxID=1069813 RepID=A0ABS9H1X9_9BACL|nr:type II secretion system F family protein [Pseudalkalibacillus berkeleyi]MCF6138106.1 type II secretion system F family protein [Pseudalkalibacillus berkeleyi]